MVFNYFEKILTVDWAWVLIIISSQLIVVFIIYSTADNCNLCGQELQMCCFDQPSSRQFLHWSEIA